MVPGFRRNDVWIPPCQARGRLIKSGMTISVKQPMRYHSIYLIASFAMGSVTLPQKYCFSNQELLDSPYSPARMKG